MVIAALGRFSASMDERLRAGRVPSALVTQLRSRATQFAQLTPPVAATRLTAIVAREAARQTYVDTFRMRVILCGMLAALSGVVAWFSIRDTGQGNR